MALMLGRLNEALLAGGTPPDIAQAASEKVAAYDNRLVALDTRVAVLMVMVGGVYALIVPAVYLLVRIGLKTGAFG